MSAVGGALQAGDVHVSQPVPAAQEASLAAEASKQAASQQKAVPVSQSEPYAVLDTGKSTDVVTPVKAISEEAISTIVRSTELDY